MKVAPPISKKFYIVVGLFVFLLIGSVSAIIVLDNGYLLDKTEMAAVTNNDISTYMTNAFTLADYKVIEDRIITYYNITYLEPTSYFNNETNATETRYRVFTQYKPFVIEKSLWNECLNQTSEATCVGVLVNNADPYIYEVTENNVTTNVTIKSTYLQAYEEQERQYYRAQEIRDNAISNDLDTLFALM